MIGARFLATAARHSGEPAVDAAGGALRYGELAAVVTRLAARLLAELGAAPARIAVVLPQGTEQIASILGVLLAGKAFVPIDPADPEARIAAIIADSEARLVLDASHPLVIGLLAAQGEAPHLGAEVSPDDLACVVYTSGSTGSPKGVRQTHRNLLHYVRCYGDTLGLAPSDRLSLLYSPGFAAAHLDVFGALLNGASVNGYDVRRRGFAGFAAWLDERRVSVLHSVPSVFRRLLQTLPPGRRFAHVRIVDLGGEAVVAGDAALVRERFAPGCCLVNHLAATELSVIAQHVVDPAAAIDGGALPVGRAADGVEVRILTPGGRDVEDGEIGEIVLRSQYLSPGYWNRPDLDAAAFTAEAGGMRTYRTGDLGRRRPDGLLEHCGRRQGRLKIRGYTVEVGEVEAAVAAVPGVGETVVAARDAHGTASLVAYWTPAPGNRPTSAEIAAAVATSLPPPMVPSRFVELAEMPRTASGKVDRLALAAVEPPDTTPHEPPVAPRTDDERAMVALWSEVLGARSIGVRDPFITLGGHSLAAAQIVARIQEVFGVALPLRALFDSPTVELLCARMRAGTGDDDRPPLRPVARSEPQVLSSIQETIWGYSHSAEGRLGFNTVLAYRLRGSLDDEALGRALRAVVRRHEPLRTTYHIVGDRPVQRIESDSIFELARHAAADGESTSDAETRLVAAAWSTPFDLAQGPSLRADLLTVNDREHLLILALHHIAFDAVSMTTFLTDLSLLYRAERRGTPDALPPHALQPFDYAPWERAWLRPDGKPYREMLDYWLRVLDPSPEAAMVPITPLVAGAGGAPECAELTVYLDAELRDALRVLCRERGVTLFMTLAAGFAAALYARTGQEDLLLESFASKRTHPGLERAMGCFINRVPLRLDVGGAPTFDDLLGRVRDRTLGVTEHCELPFSVLLEELARRGLPAPTSPISFQHVDVPYAPLALEGLETELLPRRDERVPRGLVLTVRPFGDRLGIRVAFDRSRYHPDSVREFLEEYREVLRVHSS